MTDKLDSKTTLLASTGCLAVLGGFFAYRAKATRPFKVGRMLTEFHGQRHISASAKMKNRAPPAQLAYFVAWPTLGSAIILLAQPDKQSVEDKLR